MTDPPKLLDRVRDACRVRQSSRRTAEAYAQPPGASVETRAIVGLRGFRWRAAVEPRTLCRQRPELPL